MNGSDVNATAPYSLCRRGHTGPYCAVCEEGFYPEVAGSCAECEDSDLGDYGIMAGIAVADRR